MEWIVEAENDTVSPNCYTFYGDVPPVLPPIIGPKPCPKNTGFCGIKTGGPNCPSRACGILF